ncbi:hypothetical protein [Jatrophihabitans sp.]|uniref:hypothetical protein n=1 Tax=Jatrophihabitans sp. TaxID=1932789 RepID=UPI002D08C5EB|nr:hypothetical protein [Jatrophihabitans sp.]
MPPPDQNPGDPQPVVQAADRVADRLEELVPPGNPVLADDTRLVRWAAPVFLGCAIVLVPWIVVAAATLPSRQLSQNYDVAWAGYDVGLLIGLVWTALSALRRSRRLTIAASATGALLLADAWFDVLTSPGGWDLVQAVAMSVLAELPLATLCFWLAFHSQEVAERRLVLLSGGRLLPRSGRRRSR